MRDDGILTFYRLQNIAVPGRMPVEKLVDAGNSYYSRRTVGVTRYYAAAGANRNFDTLVRCHNTPALPDGVQYVILEDGKQYRIDATQEIVEQDALDLSLVRLEANYDVAGET